MAKVFISYSSHNRDLVKALAADIEALGYDVWFDKELTGGQAWWESILQAIRDSAVFVFALSPESLASYPCSLEYKYAYELGKTILPVLLRGKIDAQVIPVELTLIQFLDYRKQNKDNALNLARAVNQLPASKALPEPLPPTPDVPLYSHHHLSEITDHLRTGKDAHDLGKRLWIVKILSPMLWAIALLALHFGLNVIANDLPKFYGINSGRLGLTLLILGLAWLLQGFVCGYLLDKFEPKNLQWLGLTTLFGGGLLIFRNEMRSKFLRISIFLLWVISLMGLGMASVIIVFSVSNAFLSSLGFNWELSSIPSLLNQAAFTGLLFGIAYNSLIDRFLLRGF